MSAQANITVYDGAGTPVVHTLEALGEVPGEQGKMLWRESLTTVPLVAQVRATLAMRTLKNGATQVSETVVVPVMETVSGQNALGYTAQPKVAHEVIVVLTMYASPRATISDRRLARQIALNLGGNIATSVTPATTGPMVEAFDKAVLPS